MNTYDARSLVAWMLKWRDNAHNGREFTTQEIATAAEHYLAGVDPWESAAAICEGRAIATPKRHDDNHPGDLDM